ncbi:hypothetical protein HY612_02005 [Candidatus Roizmanbacteria bacterium]|nr:hypothetical protein [Candidatus Roizmanbacteria bacterium]
MVCAELMRATDPLANIEKRNQDMLAIGKRAGIAIMTLLPLIHRVTRNWNTAFPFDPETDALMQKSIAEINAYGQFFTLLNKTGNNSSDDLAHWTNVIFLNLNPQPYVYVVNDQEVVYEDRDRPSRLRRFLAEYAELLKETFALPDWDDKTLDYLLTQPPDRGLELVGAPLEMEGLRFLPAYRQLAWGQEDEKAGKLVVVQRTGIPLDILQFQKEGGREFFLASTGGLKSLDLSLRSCRQYDPVGVIGAREKPHLLTSGMPAVVVDRDGTISYQPWWHEDTDEAKNARSTFFTRLHQQGIPTIIWSRNDSVFFFKEDLERLLGIQLLDPITFSNWPFFDPKSGELSYQADRLKIACERMPAELGEVIARYVQQNFATPAGQQIEDYVEILRLRIEDFMIKHFAKRRGDYLTWERLLEAKVPAFIGISQDSLSPDIRADFIRNGILVNNSFFSLESAKIFGYSLIHVDYVPHVDTAVDIINWMYANK